MAAGDNGAQEEFSLMQAVEDVSDRFSAQTESLRENQETLNVLQETLADLESKGETLEHQLASTELEVLVMQVETENLERETRAQCSQCSSLSKENADLQVDIEEEEEGARTSLARFNAYRAKMEAHVAAVSRAQSRTGAYRDLQERRALVQTLRQKKEELRKDLEDPNGNSVQEEKREIGALQVEIREMMKTIAEKTDQLQKAYETQAQLQNDIQIHTKRFEAIVKRLRCKVNRAKALRRQLHEDIHHMEMHLAELKRKGSGDQE